MSSPFQSQRVIRIMSMLYAVVIHRVNGQVIFVGYSSYNDALTFKESSMHSEWRRIVTAAAGMVEIEIAAGFQEASEAKRYWREMVVLHKPLIGTKNVVSKQKVQCIETGRVYRNASDAADAHEIHRSSMSNHLHNRKGYGSVRGLHFRRIVGTDPVE